MEEAARNFHLAIRQNDVDKVRSLLKDGVSPDEPNWDSSGRPGILEATYRGHVDVVRLLLEFDADPNAQNTLGETALHVAFHPKSFSKEIVMNLLDKGADVNVRETLNGHTPMHLAAKMLSGKLTRPQRSDLIEVLRAMSGTADLTKCNSRRETALHRLVSGAVESCDALQVLIDGGSELNAQNDRGETALMCAVDRGHGNSARLLIHSGACVNIKDRHFQTALHHSAQKNLPGVVRSLLDAQCDVNATDLNGDTALHIAASKGLADMVRVLLGSPQVDVNVQNIRGSTPLLNAVESGFTRVVELLLEAHCDADCEKGLLKALDVAEDTFVRRWHPEIFPILQEALVQKRDLWDEGETSL